MMTSLRSDQEQHGQTVHQEDSHRLEQRSSRHSTPNVVLPPNLHVELRQCCRQSLKHDAAHDFQLLTSAALRSESQFHDRHSSWLISRGNGFRKLFARQLKTRASGCAGSITLLCCVQPELVTAPTRVKATQNLPSDWELQPAGTSGTAICIHVSETMWNSHRCTSCFTVDESRVYRTVHHTCTTQRQR